jgi:hypothetical protein
MKTHNPSLCDHKAKRNSSAVLGTWFRENNKYNRKFDSTQTYYAPTLQKTTHKTHSPVPFSD